MTIKPLVPKLLDLNRRNSERRLHDHEVAYWREHGRHRPRERNHQVRLRDQEGRGYEMSDLDRYATGQALGCQTEFHDLLRASLPEDGDVAGG